MTILSSLLRDSVVQSEDDDVRAGLYGALRNLCYMVGPLTSDDDRSGQVGIFDESFQSKQCRITPRVLHAH